MHKVGGSFSSCFTLIYEPPLPPPLLLLMLLPCLFVLMLLSSLQPSKASFVAASPPPPPSLSSSLHFHCTAHCSLGRLIHAIWASTKLWPLSWKTPQGDLRANEVLVSTIACLAALYASRTSMQRCMLPVVITKTCCAKRVVSLAVLRNAMATQKGALHKLKDPENSNPLGHKAKPLAACPC